MATRPLILALLFSAASASAGAQSRASDTAAIRLDAGAGADEYLLAYYYEGKSIKGEPVEIVALAEVPLQLRFGVCTTRRRIVSLVSHRISHTRTDQIVFERGPDPTCKAHESGLWFTTDEASLPALEATLVQLRTPQFPNLELMPSCKEHSPKEFEVRKAQLRFVETKDGQMLLYYAPDYEGWRVKVNVRVGSGKPEVLSSQAECDNDDDPAPIVYPMPQQ